MDNLSSNKGFLKMGLPEITLIVDDNTYFPVGSSLEIGTKDNRWWRKFLYFILRKGKPTTRELVKVIKKHDDGHTITVSKKGN